MSDFKFEKCKNVIVKLESRILGSARQVVCSEDTDFYDVSEFLSNRPVSRIPNTKYKIMLEMTLSDDNPFLFEKFFDSIELVFSDKILCYGECSVEKSECKVQSDGFVDIKVTIAAETRDVI